MVIYVTLIVGLAKCKPAAFLMFSRHIGGFNLSVFHYLAKVDNKYSCLILLNKQNEVSGVVVDNIKQWFYVGCIVNNEGVFNRDREIIFPPETRSPQSSAAPIPF